MKARKLAAIALVGSALAVAGCTNDRNINATTGGLVGAAVGSQIGGDEGKVAATLLGAAAGTAIGGNVATSGY